MIIISIIQDSWHYCQTQVLWEASLAYSSCVITAELISVSVVRASFIIGWYVWGFIDSSSERIKLFIYIHISLACVIYST